MNLVKLITDNLDSNVMGQMGAALGESSENTGRAVSGAIPAILGGLMGSVSSGDGANKLSQALDDQDDGLLDNLGGLFSGGGHEDLAKKGSGALSSLLGDGMVGNIVGALSGFSGMGRGSAGSLIGMIAPIVLGFLRREKKSAGLDSNGLAQMLAGQKEHIQAALPQGFSDHLSKAGLLDGIMGNVSGAASAVAGAAAGAAGNVADAASDTGRAALDAGRAAAGSVADGAQQVAEQGGGMFKKLLPIAVIVIAALLAWKFFFAGTGDEMMDKAKDAGSSMMDKAKDAGSTMADKAKEMAVPDVGGDIGSMFTGMTDTLSGITDVDSAKAAVPGLTDMTSKLGGLGDALSKLPEAAQGPVQAMIGEKLPAIEGLVEKVMAIPGVGPVLKPVVEGLIEKVKAMAG